ncbi:MAG: hypothetical protein HWQ41_17455 [Nostoc sp. NOS(2021)]|uniref:hypothetical protein n=1 Tax=Nostoc sp. NOS(2021) TaxID=2815407 RepID=UPI0025FC0F1B|nr:hypothetical protein [Nostoc sp. NOS(2021)]MBN3896989.1 hypothetical protein [Nostoc sp. NOS(2021)]
MIARAIAMLPLMFIGLPSFYGASLHLFFALTQHAGLAEDVVDHHLNSRTVYMKNSTHSWVRVSRRLSMNPVFRFLYLRSLWYKVVATEKA